ncbi:MAG: UDP-N-acetylglucosamine 1-carboxyvinyltransferase [Faecalibacterium prausnitzii]|nr:UDP-N-acetylglucosamine 1-carboxyvinyltransferase [Faecalibacterium prausnitzii]MDY2681285.1 UDP-N-acetylglucosamine 1-carboxyvinyltransferase [Faecalibacterium prausnitzii]
MNRQISPAVHTMGYHGQNGGLFMAGDFVITGGHPLEGRVQIPAAKNSVLPLLAATLLCSGRVVLQGVPELSDVDQSMALLCAVGCRAQRQGRELVVEGQPRSCVLAAGPAAQMRASILFCAPLLARLGRAETVLPGGCDIGARPIDLHRKGLEKMGVHSFFAGDRLVLTAPGGLHGAQITLDFPSVGATETLLLAAALAQGETVLRGAAREPEIADLAAFLNRCGAVVQGAGSSTVRVQGRRLLTGCRYTPVADRIAAATFACACAAAGGRVELAGCAPALYAPVLEILEQMGCRVQRGQDAAEVSRYGKLWGAGKVFTGAYPGLATDAAPLLAAVMVCAQSGSSVEDVIFERRFGCAEGFAAMGARVRVRGRQFSAQPGGVLRGTEVTAPDLRGGAALVVAALAAKGKTRVSRTGCIHRGYAEFDRELASLGAQIEREIR